MGRAGFGGGKFCFGFFGDLASGGFWLGGKVLSVAVSNHLFFGTGVGVGVSFVPGGGVGGFGGGVEFLAEFKKG